MNVYILSTYEEHGAREVVATLDRSKLIELARRNWDATRRRGEWLDDSLSGLSELLEKPDEELVSGDGWNCTDGWGGMQLHIIKLEGGNGP